MRLDSKTAFVTGGASGIGAAIATAFVDAGARVVVCDISDTGADAAAALGAAGFARADVSDEQQVVAALDAATELVGGLDIVVNNAGIGPDMPPLDQIDGDLARRVLDINLRGVMYGLMHAPARMNDGGAIINTASAAGDTIALPTYGPYVVAKTGIVYLTRTSALELGSRGIRVNAVSPAGIAATGMDNEATVIETLTALERMGRLDEVTPVYVFLASDAASFITGTTIRVDGGMTAGYTLRTLGLIPDGDGSTQATP
jgi:NAD(P)-dependent dehydrogenase (short-subunit alcohol dehydrogenase family)